MSQIPRPMDIRSAPAAFVDHHRFLARDEISDVLPDLIFYCDAHLSPHTGGRAIPQGPLIHPVSVADGVDGPVAPTLNFSAD